MKHEALTDIFVIQRAQRWTSAEVSSQDHPPIAQIPALLDHVQNVGLSAGAGQTGEKEDCGSGGRVGVSEVVVIIKPIQRNLSSICRLNKLAAERSGTRNSAVWIITTIVHCTFILHHKSSFAR